MGADHLDPEQVDGPLADEPARRPVRMVEVGAQRIARHVHGLAVGASLPVLDVLVGERGPLEQGRAAPAIAPRLGVDGHDRNAREHRLDEAERVGRWPCAGVEVGPQVAEVVDHLPVGQLTEPVAELLGSLPGGQSRQAAGGEGPEEQAAGIAARDHVLRQVADGGRLTRPRTVVLGVLAEADERVLAREGAQLPEVAPLGGGVADHLEPLVHELRHVPLELGVRLPAGAPDDALVLDGVPLAADPAVHEVVGDDDVGPLDDVGVEARLGPVDVRPRVAVGAPLDLARLDEVGEDRRVGDRGADALARLARVLVAARAEHVVPEVGEHPDVVVLGDGVGGQEEDVHRSHPKMLATCRATTNPPANIRQQMRVYSRALIA